jgi:hypothetical protein
LSIIKAKTIPNRLVEISILAGILVVFLIAMQLAYGQSGQDNLNAIDNYTHSLVTACSSLGEADTNYMIFCSNLLETIHEQCQQVSFSFCNTDVFGKRSK